MKCYLFLMFFLILASVLWAFSFGLIKTQLNNLDPVLVTSLRVAISCLLFLPFIKIKPNKHSLSLILIGMIQIGLMYLLYFYSFQFLSAHEIALLTITTPIYMIFINSIFQKKMNIFPLSAAIMAIISSYILVSHHSIQSNSFKGILAIQTSNISFAVGQLLYKHINKVEKISQTSSFFWLFLGALIICSISTLIFTDPNHFSNISYEQWLIILYLGAIPSAIGFYLWNKGVSKVSVSVLSVLNNLKIPLAVLISWLIFNESIQINNFLLSLTLFFFALYLANLKRT